MAKNKSGKDPEPTPVTGDFFSTIGRKGGPIGGRKVQASRSPEERARISRMGGEALRDEVEQARQDDGPPKRFGR
jgi:hypothetical protein